MSKLEDALENFDEDEFGDLDESSLEWWDFEDQGEMVDAIAGDIQFIIESALDARGDALLALPASDEAMPVLEALAAKDIKWKYVTIIPTHDYLVPVDDPRSAVKKLATLFLTRGARVLPLAPDHDDYQLAGSAADARLQDMKWPPDLIWLGMGADGSTAGIVESGDMEEALDGAGEKRAVGLMPDDGDEPLVTITKPAICEARTVIVLLKGAASQMMLESEIERGATSMAAIGRVFADLSVPVDIYVEK